MNKERVELTDDNVEEIGVLMPALAYRFRLVLTNDDTQIISRQITKLKLDYVKNELTIWLVHPQAGASLINFIADNTKNIQYATLTMLNAKGDSAYDLPLGLRMKSHDFTLSYDNDNVAEHVIVFHIE